MVGCIVHPSHTEEEGKECRDGPSVLTGLKPGRLANRRGYRSLFVPIFGSTEGGVGPSVVVGRDRRGEPRLSTLGSRPCWVSSTPKDGTSLDGEKTGGPETWGRLKIRTLPDHEGHCLRCTGNSRDESVMGGRTSEGRAWGGTSSVSPGLRGGRREYREEYRRDPGSDLPFGGTPTSDPQWETTTGCRIVPHPRVVDDQSWCPTQCYRKGHP